MSERVAFVTGASRGIGKATAVALAAGGLRRRDHGPHGGGGRGARALVDAEVVRHVSSARQPLVDRRVRARHGPRGTHRAGRPARPCVARRGRDDSCSTLGVTSTSSCTTRATSGPATWTASSTRRSSCSRSSSTGTCSPARAEQAAAPVDDRARRRHRREHHVGVGLRGPHEAGRRRRLGHGLRRSRRARSNASPASSRSSSATRASGASTCSPV